MYSVLAANSSLKLPVTLKQRPRSHRTVCVHGDMLCLLSRAAGPSPRREQERPHGAASPAQAQARTARWAARPACCAPGRPQRLGELRQKTLCTKISVVLSSEREMCWNLTGCSLRAHRAEQEVETSIMSLPSLHKAHLSISLSPVLTELLRSNICVGFGSGALLAPQHMS